MERYIAWFNATAPNAESTIQQAPVRAAIAHLYFESIHPFEDGNGRIGRVLAEKALIQTIGAPALMSLSATLEHNKAAYYAALKKAQHTLNINGWLDYFIRVILDAQERAQKTILFTLTKAKFFNEFNNRLNPRQAKVIDRMFMAGPGGFEGGMTATKYMRIARTSKATATRDLQELVAMRALVVQGQGRSTRYGLFMQAHP
jgi:Fic family protein